MKKKILIVGAGYVGSSLGVLLSKQNKVCIVDKDLNKVNLLNNKESPIKDEDIESFFNKYPLDLEASIKIPDEYEDADFLIICTPTNYDEDNNYFDTSSVESVIQDSINQNPERVIIIKSTIPVGFVDSIRKKYKTKNVIFSPEFLREGSALYDNLYPSRIVIGDDSSKAHEFVEILQSASFQDEINCFFVGTREAESIKLFANTFLAMRISFFNELDTYCFENNMSTESVIKGISSDARIGDFYNNPSFGYGGYCLPKDTKQLLSNFSNIPQELMKAIIVSNKTRKDFIARKIIELNPAVVGIYRLTMKSNSDNFRFSSIQGIMRRLRQHNKDVIIYEPNIDQKTYDDYKVIKDLEEFKEISDIVLANRKTDDITDIPHKLFTRDIFMSD